MLVMPMSAAAASNTKIVQLLQVTADGARVRKGPSSDYDVVTSVKKGGRVFYLGKTKDAFCYVRTSTGQVGYMYRGFLKSYGAVNRDQVYCCKKSAKIYKRNGKSLKRMGVLAKNEHVIVYEVRGNWAYVKTLSGKSGYMKKSLLKKAS